MNCAPVWSQGFGYDSFGNITKSGTQFWPGNSFLPTYNSATNRIASLPGATISYDADGNLTNDSVHSYSFDMYGSATTIDGVNLTYDALGRMVEQTRNSSYTQIVYGPDGSKLALMNGQTLTKAFVPLPGGATAVYGPPWPIGVGLIYYRHSDWLGSSRLASTPGRTVYYDGAYAPFGESYAETGTADHSFTGQNEDTVPGLDDFMFREYSASQQGRWISPDPAGLAVVDPSNPQSWNRYAYVFNNPANSIDVLGLGTCLGPDGPYPCDNQENKDPGAPDGSSDNADRPMWDRHGIPFASYITVWLEALKRAHSSGRGGGANNWLVQVAKNFCSAYPDVTQVGAGVDFGAGYTGGVQVTLNANGNSGELSLSWTWVLRGGVVEHDAYVLGGIVRNAPTNQSLQGNSFGGALAVSRTGISGNPNNIQGTFGPSVLPATFGGQASKTLNLITVPYAGYVMNEVRGACTVLFGKHS